jgi:hypothetical protein
MNYLIYFVELVDTCKCYKLARKFRVSKKFNWADYIESFKIDSTQLARLKSFESLNFSYKFLVASANVKINVNKFFKIISIG